MISAYVFLQFGAGAPVDIITDIRQIEGVKQAHVVTGPDDIIAYVEAKDMQALEAVIMEMRNAAVLISSDTRVAWSL